MKAWLLLPALLCSVGASAQSTGSLFGRGDEFANGWSEDSREVRLIGTRYGDCVVKKQAAAAHTLVLAQGIDLDRRTYDRLIEKVGDGPCLVDATRSFGGVQMRFPGDSMRYTLADALFRVQPVQAPLTISASLPTLAHPSFNEAEYKAAIATSGNKRRVAELTAQRTQAIGRIFISAFGECVVRANPAGALQLLRSGVLTPEENSAFGALAPAFSQCLNDGQKLTLNKAGVRGTIALNHYRLADALRQGK